MSKYHEARTELEVLRDKFNEMKLHRDQWRIWSKRYPKEGMEMPTDRLPWEIVHDAEPGESR